MKPDLPSIDPKTAGNAARAGIDGLVVDWENRGKRPRHEGFETGIEFGEAVA